MSYRQRVTITKPGEDATVRVFDASTLNRLRFRVDSYVSHLHPSFEVEVGEVEPDNTYKGHVITDLTVDETGRFPVPENYYPQSVRDAVNQGATTIDCEVCGTPGATKIGQTATATVWRCMRGCTVKFTTKRRDT